MLELVFAPCSPIAGGDVNWIGKKDEEIIDATMGAPRYIAEIYRRDVSEIYDPHQSAHKHTLFHPFSSRRLFVQSPIQTQRRRDAGELARLFPAEIADDAEWPATSAAARGSAPTGGARLRKYAVVRVPRSVYAATPGRNKYRHRAPRMHKTIRRDEQTDSPRCTQQFAELINRTGRRSGARSRTFISPATSRPKSARPPRRIVLFISANCSLHLGGLFCSSRRIVLFLSANNEGTSARWGGGTH